MSTATLTVTESATVPVITTQPLAQAVNAGIDLFIGEVQFHHRGLGAPIIRQFLNDIVFSDPAVESCIIGCAIQPRGSSRMLLLIAFSSAVVR